MQKNPEVKEINLDEQAYDFLLTKIPTISPQDLIIITIQIGKVIQFLTKFENDKNDLFTDFC